MPVLTEPIVGPNFIVSEANATRSRDEVTLVPGTAVRSGQLAARRDSDLKYQTWNPTGTPPGAGQVRGIFMYDSAATGTGTPSTRIAMLARDAEVNADELDYVGSTAGQVATGNAGLLALGIVPREGL
jgi:hypothetical protein